MEVQQQTWKKSLALAAGILAALTHTLSAAPVTVWMKLPQTTDLSERAKAMEALERLRSLLPPDAEEELVSAPSSPDPWMRIKASGWSPEAAPEKRGEVIADLSGRWDLRVIEHADVLPLNEQTLNATRPQEKTKLPQALSSLEEKIQGRYGELLQGKFDKTYDNSSRRAEAAVTAPKAPSRRYESEIQAAARDAGIDADILRALVAAKSGFKANISYGRAYGLMGISEASGKKYGYSAAELLDPEINLKVGADIFASLLQRFNGDIHRALAAYQLGPVTVERSGGIPNDDLVKGLLAAFEKHYSQDTGTPRIADIASIPSKKSAHKRDEPVRCGSAPISKYRPLFEEYGKRYEVDPKLLEAMVMRENPWGDPCLVSSAGAIGLGQLMPETAAMLGVKNPASPRENIKGMAKHTSYLLGLYGVRYVDTGYTGPLPLALAAYNAGEGSVQKYGNKIPRFDETRMYVRVVLRNYYDLTGNMHAWEEYMAPTRTPTQIAKVKSKKSSVKLSQAVSGR